MFINNLYFCIKKSIIMHLDRLICLIKERRQQMQVSQEMLSEISGVALRTVKQFESGKGNPTLKTLMKLTDALGLEITLQVKKRTDV
jgi:transcriptional regulator with XRE-family HTH domain